MPILLLLLTALAWAGPAEAQRVYRCVSADGVSMYVDRPCQRLGVAEREQPESQTGTGESALPEPEMLLGCPATDAAALESSLREAVARRDANALAGMYLWSGMGRRAAESVFHRFDTLIEAGIAGVSRQHLGEPVAAEPVERAEDTDAAFAVAPDPAAAALPGGGETDDTSATPAAEAVEAGNGAAIAAPAAPSPVSGDGWQAAIPDRLVVQHRDGSVTRFAVRRQAGCLWLRFAAH